jgi:hypothetical protein
MGLLVACSSDKRDEKKAVTAKVQSAPYELLVVADKEWLKTEKGQVLVQAVEAPIEGLPQMEGNFRVTYINPYSFNATFKTYANIVMAEVAPKHQTAKMGVQKNVYARPQVILSVLAPTGDALADYVATHGKQMLAMLNENEFERERKLLKKTHSGVVVTKAKAMFGVNIYVPKDVDDLKVGKDFLWASASKQDFRQNLCLYTTPMQDMTADRLVEVRDSVMHINIPGGREGQWMETDMRTVSASMVKVGGQDVLSVRGLWDMREDAMGGPFVCYVYPDYTNGRLLLAEGFVFAPDEKKRPIIRQMEAALQTLTFVADTHK